MKRLLFIALLVVFACEDEPEPKDCAGVEGGTATVDNCDDCVGGTTGEVACNQDCADVWGGNNICGCVDSTATNYDSTATFDDDNCLYDTTPPTVSISSPVSGQTVNGVVTITVTTQDNEGISKVEFFIDDSLHFTDIESPYQYDWNTTTYDDTSHIVKVISYDTSDNTTESQPILLIVDNRVYLWGEGYSIESTDSLDLGYNNLTGSIPPEIGNLTNLTYLILHSNQLTGEIPSEIGNLTNLYYLSLHNNEFTGSIPPEIGNLTNLTNLYLSSNQLTGSIPPEIGNLINLELLYLNENQLTGSIPPEIGNLTNLGSLSLQENQLTGEIPPEIWNLTNLTNLRLHSNQLTGEISESICDLDLSWTNFSHSNLYNNQLCPPYPSCINSQEIIGYQDISDCPELECDEGYLQIVNFCYWEEDLDVLQIFIDNSSETINMAMDDNGNGVIEPLELSVQQWEESRLTYLGVNWIDDGISGEIPVEIGNLTNLTTLNLWHQQLTGSIPPEIGDMANLIYLDLSSNQLTGEIPSEIGNLTNLNELDLGRNQLTDLIPSEIGNLINLNELELNHNQLTGSIPSEIGNLTNLTWLYLDDNQLTGSIPPC